MIDKTKMFSPYGGSKQYLTVKFDDHKVKISIRNVSARNFQSIWFSRKQAFAVAIEILKHVFKKDPAEKYQKIVTKAAIRFKKEYEKFS